MQRSVILLLMKRLIALLLLVLSVTVIYSAPSNFFDSHFNDFEENLATASEQNKHGIFIFFYLQDCPFCHKMRKTVFNQALVIELYKKYFLNYEVDANGALELVDFNGEETTEKVFATKKYNVFATPVLAFFDLKGKLVFYRTGFVSKKDFLLLSEFVTNKKYLTTNFIRYKIQKTR